MGAPTIVQLSFVKDWDAWHQRLFELRRVCDRVGSCGQCVYATTFQDLHAALSHLASTDAPQAPSAFVVISCHGTVPREQDAGGPATGGAPYRGRGEFEVCTPAYRQSGDGNACVDKCWTTTPAEVAGLLRRSLAAIAYRTVYVIFAQCGGLGFASLFREALGAVEQPNVIVLGLAYDTTASLVAQGSDGGILDCMHLEVTEVVAALCKRDQLERTRLSYATAPQVRRTRRKHAPTRPMYPGGPPPTKAGCSMF